jgi:hypothetical protein
LQSGPSQNSRAGLAFGFHHPVQEYETMAKNKNRLPKRIAGVKVPKALRKSQFGNVLASPLGLAALTLAAAGGGRAIMKPGSKTRTFIDDAIGSASSSGGNFVHALNEAARAFTTALQAGRTDDTLASQIDEPASDKATKDKKPYKTDEPTVSAARH